MRIPTTLLVAILFANSLPAQNHGYSFPPVGELPVSEFLPDPFIMQDGSRVKTRADWDKQREYLKAMIQHYLFGFRPPAPKNVEVQVSGPSTNRNLKFTVKAPSGKSFSFDAGMFVPPGDGPFPVVIRNDRRAVPPQTEMAARRGYIMISYNRTQLDEDQLSTASNSNNRFPAQEAYPDYSWETIMCWSWGYSIIIDWLETQPGDCVADADANTAEVLIKNCTLRGNRARGILLGSRGRMVIEGNTFHIPGAAILFEGDARFWFEQSGVRDVVIRGNTFDNCNYGVWGTACIDVKSGIADEFKQTTRYNRNITIEHNLFRVFSPLPLLSIYSVDGLIFRSNRLERTQAYPAGTTKPEPMFDITDSDNVKVEPPVLLTARQPDDAKQMGVAERSGR